MIVIGIEVSDGLSANSQESIVMANNRKAREAISTILHKKNGCLTSVSLIEHRFCYTLPLYQNQSIQLYSRVEIERNRITIESVIDRLYITKYLTENRNHKILGLINNWNMKNRSGSKILWKNNVIAIVCTKPMIGSMKPLLVNSIEMCEQDILSFLRTFVKKQQSQQNPRIKALVKEIKMLRQFFQFSRNSRQKSSHICLAKNSPITKGLNPEIEDFQELSQAPLDYQFVEDKLRNMKNSKSRETTQKIMTLIQILQKKQVEVDCLKLFITNNSLIENFYCQVKMFYLENSINFSLTSEFEQQIQPFVSSSKVSGLSSSNYRQNKKLECKLYEEYQLLLIQKKPLPKTYKFFQIELEILQYLRNQSSPYLASYYFEITSTVSFKESQTILIDFYSKRLTQVDNRKIINCLKKITEGIYFLSVNKLCHRDLKPSNIMLDQQENPRIIDLGSACYTYESSMRGRCTRQELRTTKFYNKFFSNSPPKIQLIYSKEQYQQHKYYDIYAFGKIIQDFHERLADNLEGADFMMENLDYVSKKCCEQNPDDRLAPLEVILYLDSLSKYKKLVSA